jgi:hypothetical protein
MELLSGLSWSEQTSVSLASEPLSLDQIISQISCQQPAQPYIDIDFTVSPLTSVGIFLLLIGKLMGLEWLCDLNHWSTKPEVVCWNPTLGSW